MIKIERIESGGHATVVKNGIEMAVYKGLLITYAELKSLQVQKGSVLYSINESEIVLVKAPEPEPELNSSTTNTTKKIIYPDKVKNLNNADK
jgi:hypothetical protein